MTPSDHGSRLIGEETAKKILHFSIALERAIRDLGLWQTPDSAIC
jgi:hypothetical protein